MRAGRKSEIAESLGVDRKTVRKYIGAGGGGRDRAGRAADEPRRSGRSWCAGWFPELADTRLRQVTWPAIEEHHEYIAAQLKAGVTDGDDPSAAA